VAQSADQAEIDAIKTEMRRLTERLQALEDRRAAANPQTGAPVATRPETPPAVLELNPDTAALAASVDARRYGATAVRGPGRSVAVLAAPTDRALQDATSLFQVLAAKDSTRASLKLSSEISEPLVGGTPGKTGWGTTSQWVLTASGALDKKSDRTDLFSIGELNSDFDLKLQYNRRWSLLRVAQASDVADLKRDSIAACEKALEPVKKAADCAKDYAKRGSGFVGDWLGSEQEDAYLNQVAPDGLGFVLGFEGNVGRKTHNFIDPALLKADDDKHTPFGVKVFGSLLPARSISTFTVSLNYLETWEDEKTKIVCPTAVTGPSVTCLNGALGPPTEKHKLIQGVEWRGLIPLNKDWLIPNLGVSAQLLKDYKSDEWSLDVPIYFAPDDKGKLIGGVRFGYTSEEDEFRAGVFIGAPFSPR